MAAGSPNLLQYVSDVPLTVVDSYVTIIEFMKTSHLNAFTLSLLAAAMQCGCQLNSRQAAVEEESRHQASTIRDLRHQVEQNEELLAEQDREIEVLRHPESNPFATISADKIKTVSATEETQLNWGSVAAIQIHRLTSGIVPGTSNDTQVLNIVLQPIDEDAELVKIAGELTLNVAAVGPEGESAPIANKSWSITDSRKRWTRGLVSSGFHLQLPLPGLALTKTEGAITKLLVTATLDLGVGRTFSTSELFDVQ